MRGMFIIFFKNMVFVIWGPRNVCTYLLFANIYALKQVAYVKKNHMPNNHNIHLIFCGSKT